MQVVIYWHKLLSMLPHCNPKLFVKFVQAIPNVEEALSTAPNIAGQERKLVMNLQKPSVNFLSLVMAIVNGDIYIASENFMMMEMK